MKRCITNEDRKGIRYVVYDFEFLDDLDDNLPKFNHPLMMMIEVGKTARTQAKVKDN